MSLKQILEEHALVLTVIVAVSAGGTVFGVASYFHDKELKDLQGQLDSHGASIRRDLPGAEPLFDVRSLLLSRDDVKPTSGGTYLSELEVHVGYAPAEWTFEVLTDIEFGRLLVPGIQIPSSLPDSDRNIYFWRSDFQIEFRTGDEEVLFPYVSIQRISSKQFQDIIGIGIALSEADDVDDFDFEASDVDSDYLEGISETLFSDIAAFVLMNTIASKMKILSGKRFRLSKVQKVGPIYYAQMLVEHYGIIKPDELTTVYERTEQIVIGTHEGIVILQMNIPSTSPTPSSQFYSEAALWLKGLKVVVD